MMDYKDAVKEYGEEFADAFLDTEYNQFIRGLEYFFDRLEEDEYEELHLVEEEF